MRETLAARFDRVLAHPRYAEVMARSIALRMAEGDIGVAFLHGRKLVDFVRFDV